MKPNKKIPEIQDDLTPVTKPINHSDQKLVKWIQLINPKANGFKIWPTKEVCELLKNCLPEDIDKNLDQWLEENNSWIEDGEEQNMLNPPQVLRVMIPIFDLEEGNWLSFNVWFKFGNEVELKVDDCMSADISKILDQFEKEAGMVDNKVVTYAEAIQIMQKILITKGNLIPEL